jgi:hypothetical protein
VVWVKSLVPYGYLIATLETASRDRDGFSYLEGWVPDPDCPAMRHRVDYDADTMELRIPRDCLHRRARGRTTSHRRVAVPIWDSRVIVQRRFQRLECHVVPGSEQSPSRPDR